MSDENDDGAAPEGEIWLCPACGRTGKQRYRMGDTSCTTWAQLVDEASIERNDKGVIVKARAWLTAQRCLLCGVRSDAFGCYETCTANGPMHAWGPL